MADGYISAPFETDTAVLLERADVDLRNLHPDVELSDGSLTRWQVETDARTAADIGTLALSVSEEVVRAVLGRLLDEPAWPAISASSTATLTVTGDVTAVVPAGTYLEGAMPDGSPVTVATVTDVSIPSGTTTATVEVVAVDPGESPNGAEGELLGMEVWAWGVSASLDAPLSGGADPEDQLQHLNRLVQLARLARPRPIKPDEFAEFVRLKTPGVAAAVALNMVRPGSPPETDVERCVTVGVRAADGTAPSSGVITAANALLDAAREATFESYVLPANYTTVNVALTVRVWPGYDDAQTQELVKAAIRSYLSPATWGAPPTSGDAAAGDGPVWAQSPEVRVEEIVEAVGQVTAVDYAPRASVLINGVNANLTMPGLLPLPRQPLPDDIDVTVEPR